MHWRARFGEIIGFLLFAFATWAFNQPGANAGPKDAYLVPPPEMIDRFTFGFAESTADSLWLRWIQDGDRCQTYAGTAHDEAAAAATAPSSPEFDVPRHKVCDQSWSFKMLDAVTRVAPHFKMPYLAGSMTLAVLVEDYEGASVVFERAIAAYPDDWAILYRAGYHYLYDMHDLTKAGELMTRAADHGAPSWVKLLAARIYTKAGQAALGITTLETYLKTLKGDEHRAEIQRRIDVLRKQLAAGPRVGP